MFLKTSFVALALLAASPATMADEGLVSDREIDGRPISQITATLEAQGIAVTGVEKWGDALRIHAQNASGANYSVLVDEDTLRPFAAVPAVATSLDVGTTPDAKRVAPSSSQTTISLSENNND